MAFSGESAQLTWQRVKMFLALTGASPLVVAQFKALKSSLAQLVAGGSPKLQFVYLDKTTNSSGDGNADQVICGGACRLYGLYLKKNTGTTAGYNKISNHATAVQAQGEIILASTAASEQCVYVNHVGKDFTTGATYASDTTYNGTTRSLLVDSSDGFAIIAAE